MSLYLRTVLVSRTGVFSHAFQIHVYSLHTLLAWVLPHRVMETFLLSCTYDLLVILPLRGGRSSHCPELWGRRLLKVFGSLFPNQGLDCSRLEKHDTINGPCANKLYLPSQYPESLSFSSFQFRVLRNLIP